MMTKRSIPRKPVFFWPLTMRADPLSEKCSTCGFTAYECICDEPVLEGLDAEREWNGEDNDGQY
jgi:hypothetical protein